MDLKKFYDVLLLTKEKSCLIKELSYLIKKI